MANAFRLEELDHQIGLVTLDLPDKKVNTLGRAVLMELAGLVKTLAGRADLRGYSFRAASPASSSRAPISTSSGRSPTRRASKGRRSASSATSSSAASDGCRSRPSR